MDEDGLGHTTTVMIAEMICLRMVIVFASFCVWKTKSDTKIIADAHTSLWSQSVPMGSPMDSRVTMKISAIMIQSLGCSDLFGNMIKAIKNFLSCIH